jgi:hypothetical protein
MLSRFIRKIITKDFRVDRHNFFYIILIRVLRPLALGKRKESVLFDYKIYFAGRLIPVKPEGKRIFTYLILFSQNNLVRGLKNTQAIMYCFSRDTDIACEI